MLFTRRRTAVGIWASMVGAIVLSRLSDDPELSDELLAQTQASIRDQLKRRDG
jgi:TetR/AcrR family transcriptional repressor of nem operon